MMEAVVTRNRDQYLGLVRSGSDETAERHLVLNFIWDKTYINKDAIF